MFPRSFSRLGEEMEGLMEKFFGPEEGWLPRAEGFVPRTDLMETDNGYEVIVELPGLKPEEVKVELHDGALWISGEKKEEKEEEGKTWHRVERRWGEFRRVFPLGTAVMEDKVEAEFKHGVLKVTIPKSPEAKPRHIEVKA
jgi:HSP20 family protein